MTPTFLSSDSGYIQSRLCPAQDMSWHYWGFFVPPSCATSLPQDYLVFVSYQRKCCLSPAGRRSWMKDILGLRQWICVLGGRKRYLSAILDCRFSPCSSFPQWGVLTSTRSGYLMVNKWPTTCKNLKCWWILASKNVEYFSTWYCALLLLWFKIYCPSLPCTCFSLSPQTNSAGPNCLLAWKQRCLRAGVRQ